jgi:SAM-dependent methyltransferase
MNRQLTNAIRYLMDEWLPPVLRDSRWFMYPFFWLAYGGKNIGRTMDFKRLVHSWSPEEYRDFYGGLDSISRNRATDLNEATIQAMLAALPQGPGRLLDVGCGRGYFLARVREARPDLELVGCDVVDKSDGSFRFETAFIEKLPFPDRSFDIVTCSHTLEHITNPQAAVAELKRVAKRALFVVVPRQRYYFYTLDEHVNFYPHRHLLLSEMGEPSARCENIQGDWLWMSPTTPRPSSPG